MSIATEITRLQNAKAAIKQALENKGVSVLNATLDNYPTLINNMQNTKYGISMDSILGDLNANGKLLDVSSRFNLTFDDVLDIGNNALEQRFQNNKKVQTVTFPDLTTISGSGAVRNGFSSSYITSVSFPELVTISGNASLSNAFASATYLTSVSFPKLTTVGNGCAQLCFSNCTNQDFYTISFPELTSVGNNGFTSIFSGCSYLESVSFPKLTSIGSYGFSNAFKMCYNLESIEFTKLNSLDAMSLQECFHTATGLASIRFPALTSTSFSTYTNAFNRMLYGVSGCTVHFPSNLQSVIGSWSDVTSGFGGTNISILYDLTATN